MVFVERGARPSFVAVAGILAGHVPAFGLEARAPQLSESAIRTDSPRCVTCRAVASA